MGTAAAMLEMVAFHLRAQTLILHLNVAKEATKISVIVLHEESAIPPGQTKPRMNVAEMFETSSYLVWEKIYSSSPR